MYEALYYEARGESKEGIIAVASVIKNRVYSGKYKRSYCSVIYAKKQFSFVHLLPQRKLPKPDSSMLTVALYDIAVKTVTNSCCDLPDNVLWYHTVNVKPKWSKKLNRYSVIDRHIFYKD